MDYQETLLSFYTQQLVSHGAQLFAASIAAFTFITKFINESKHRRSKIFFVVGSGFLLGIMIFILFRLLVYGALSSSVIRFPIPERQYNNSSNCTLGHYQDWIRSYTFGQNTTIRLDNASYTTGWEDPHIPNATFIGTYLKSRTFSDFLFNFPGDWFARPFGLPLCFYLGLFSAYMIRWAFATESFSYDENSGRFWFVYFAYPPIIGIIGALFSVGNLSNYLLTCAIVLIYGLPIVLPTLSEIRKKLDP
jgi:hypothetical protein